MSQKNKESTTYYIDSLMKKHHLDPHGYKKKTFWKHFFSSNCNLPYLILAIFIDIIYFFFTIYIKENTTILKKNNILFSFIIFNWLLLGLSLIIMTLFEYRNLFNYNETKIHKTWAEDTRFFKMIIFTIPSTILLFLISFNFLKLYS